MTLFYNLLNNNLINQEIVIFGLFTGIASILGYLIFIFKLNNIIISVIKYFIILNNQFITKIQQYLRIFRFLTMLFMLLKFIWIYDLVFYSLCISTVILLGYVFYRYRLAFSACTTKMSMMLFISSITKKITVYPDRNRTQMTNFDIVERKFEFDISNEQIQEIINSFGPNVINNVITGQNANQIVDTHVMPLIRSSEMHSLFLEILNPF
jgi:hypothetical protein